MGSKKLTVFLLLACLLKYRLSYSQTGPLITLNEKDVPLQKVLDEIHAKTGYAYYGEGEWPKIAHRVSLSVRDVTLRQVLDICFQDQPVLYELDDKERYIFVRLRAKEDRRIHGWVIDENRDPIGGVSIVASGDASTVSNDEGEFFLDTHFSDSRLLVSSIGYDPQELPLPPVGKELTIKLQSRVRALIEAVVVHTGYQDVKRKATTGSFDEVDNELVNRRVSTNILDRIDGVTSGVLFNKNIVTSANQSTITIRGRSTIYANPNPLIVIDNFPYPGDINNINPADVESITVLKDAAAAAIWGAFSGNGVIVITTKKGRMSQQPRFSFSSSLTVGAKPDLYYQKILSSSDYIDIEQKLWGLGFYDNALVSPQYPALSPVVEILDSERNGLLDNGTAQAKINALRKVDTRKDLDKYFYRSSLNSQYALNVSGGDERDQYYVSAGYDQNLSNLVRNQYDRVTLTGNNTYNLIPGKLELNTGLAFTASTSYLNNTGGNTVNYPYAQLADVKGNPLPVNLGLRMPYVDTVGKNEPGVSGQLLDWHYRPLDELRNADNRVSLTDYRINIGLRYSILKSLDLHAYYQFGRGDSDLVNYNSLNTYYTRNLINSFTQTTGGMLSYPVPKGGIMHETDDGYTQNNLRIQLNYSDTLFRHGLLNAIGGVEVRDIEGKDRNSWEYGYDPDLGVGMPVDYLHTYPEYTTGLPIQLPYLDGTVGTSERYLSYYTNAVYSWRGRYMVSGSARRDESNLFGVRANQKGVPLWSGGLAWDVSKEKFYHLRELPFLKLRVTDGYTGNVDRNLSAYTTANVNGGVNSYGTVTATIINPPNPDLRWERINIFNVGLDFATTGGRLGGTVEYFIKSGVDLIGPSPIDPTTGVSVFQGNAANMRDNGIDISLHTDHNIGAVHWNSVLMFSYVLDKVTNYKVQLGSVDNYLSLATINPLVGHPLYSVYALRWKGLDTIGNPVGILNGMDTINYGSILSSNNLHDLIYKGPVNPPVFGSWRNNFSWKQWGLSFNIVYKFGYVFRRNSIFYDAVFFGLSAGHPDYERRWQRPGDEKFTNVPSMNYPPDPQRDEFYQNSEVLVVKGDHIRLQDVQLSYDWDKQSHPRLPLQSIRFYLYANNLGILWKANHYGIDPDFVSGMPNPRTLAFGVKIEY
jgi:TonB-linked SusC/RagA family outer membrane protein